MRILTLILMLTAVLAPGQPRAEGDPQAGAGAYATCASCHGSRAEGSASLKAPRLNHLTPSYLASQLEKFQRGLRSGEGASTEAVQMAGMAGTLADSQAVLNVAVYIAALESASPPSTIEGDIGLGADYYNQFCGACHGPAAEGNPALNSPALAGTDDWYLLAQLEAFRSGPRGAHPDDRTGRQMRAMAGVLPDEKAMWDVVSFIGSLAQ